MALTRVLSIAEWHHFAYMIISLALLGFAASGTAIALVGRRLQGREVAAFRFGALLLIVALPASHALGQLVPFETFELLVQPIQFAWLFLLYLILAVPFFLVSWCITLGFLIEPERVGRVYFANMVGSGLGATGVVGLLFLVPPGRVPLLLVIPTLVGCLISLPWRESARGGSPQAGVPPGSEAGEPPAAPETGRRTLLPWLGGLAGSGLAALLIGSPPVQISQYKGLAYALDLPDATVVAVEESPVSVVTAVSSGLIRETPGQISGYPMGELGALPEQVGLYFDADAVSPVHRFRGELGPFAFLDYVTPALPYQILRGPRVLVVGAGGGTEVLNALVHGAGAVTAVEVDPSVFPLLRGPLAEFAGGLYDRPEVTPVVAEGRGWLEAHPEARFDLIQISLLDSFTASAAGVRALSESYLYTVQAVQLYLDRLTPGGVLAVSRWLRTPARDAVKMLATLAEAAERSGIERPADHLAFVRSWNTGTLVLSRSPLGPGRVQAIRRWAAARGFDLAWLPGLGASEVNRYTVLEQPVYWEAARRILAADPAERERFYREYAFHVRPATDDRPYYFRFFRWGALERVLEALGSQWRNAVEWGYVVLVATFVQAAAAALFLVLLPLAALTWWRRRRAAARVRESPPAESDPGTGGPGTGGSGTGGPGTGGPGTAHLILYFGALGLAYLFLEIAFIQKLMLFLAHPVYAVAVVLAAFLVFSGLGSAAADRLVGGGPAGRSSARRSSARRSSAGRPSAGRSSAEGSATELPRGLVRRLAGGRSRQPGPGRSRWLARRPPRLVAAAVLLIGVMAGAYLLFLPELFAAAAGWPGPAKVAASLALLAPLAFLMGIPFPTGLQLLARCGRPLVAWAWAVNGAASVVAAPLATLGAVHLGFAAVVGMAVGLYAGAAADLGAWSGRATGAGLPWLRG